MKETLSIVIPFLNESENIPRLVQSLQDFFTNQKPYNTEVIFVDDGSTDDSSQKLITNGVKGISSKVVRLSRNFGSHAALRAGIMHSSGKYIMFMYADLQDPLELADTLYAKCTTEKCDIAWASREMTQNSFSERTFSKTYASLMQRFAIASYPANGFDIVMFSDKVRAELNRNIEANSSIFLQILTLGFKQTSITYNKQERKAGKSKWTLSKKIKLFIDSFVAFSYAPIRFVTLVGIVLFSLGIIWSAYIILRKILVGDLDPGWPTLIAILMIGFGVTNISLGIIAEYLWRTLDASRKRPVYIIEEITDIKNEQ